MQIIHRDLAARNILIDKERVCKVADFGFARDIVDNHVYERKSDGRLPIRYVSFGTNFRHISIKARGDSFNSLTFRLKGGWPRKRCMIIFSRQKPTFGALAFSCGKLLL